MSALTRLKTLVVVASLVMFAAGVIVGMLGRRATGESSYLARELDLTAEQREKMRTIWSDALAKAPPPTDAEMRRIERERLDAVRNLLSPEQAAQYDALQQQYDDRIRRLDEDARAAFRGAEDRTREILTDKQRARFDELIRTREGRRAILPVGDRKMPPAGQEKP